MKLKLKNGISLIVLVITIIVMIVLAGAVILALSNSGIIEKATSSAFKTDVKTIKEEYEYKMAELKLSNEIFDQTSLNASDTTLSYNTKIEDGGNIYSLVPTAEKYKNEFEIRDGELRYKGENYKKLNWAEEVGITTNRYEIVDGVLLSSNANLLLVGTDGKIRIPSNVVKIGEGAFSNVNGLKEVTIPGNVKEIGESAFANNKTLEKVVIENGVDIIGYRAFNACTSLKTVSMTDSVTKLSRESFNSCIELKNITLSNSIESISYNFTSCYKLKEIKLPDKLKGMSDSFKNVAITKIHLPKYFKDMYNCFVDTNISEITIDEDNTNLCLEDGVLYTLNKTKIIYMTSKKRQQESINIAEGVTTLDASIFTGSNIKYITLPSTLTTIESRFYSENIESITVAETNQYFTSKDGSLYNKDMTKTVAIISDEEKINIPNGVKIIGTYSLYLCKNAKEVVFPESVNELESYSIINGLRTVESVSMGANLNKITHLALYNGYNLKNVSIDSANKTYSSDSDFLYKLDNNGVKKEIVACIANKSEISIPEGIEKLGTYSFYSNKLSNVTMPTTLKEISNSAYDTCVNLNNIEIPSSVTTIAGDVFRSCKLLTNVKINKSKGSISGAPWGIPIGERAITWTEN